jgi:hypothetical protein
VPLAHVDHVAGQLAAAAEPPQERRHQGLQGQC